MFDRFREIALYFIYRLPVLFFRIRRRVRHLSEKADRLSDPRAALYVIHRDLAGGVALYLIHAPAAPESSVRHLSGWG